MTLVGRVRPPFDPEVAPVLPPIREMVPRMNLENLSRIRELVADGIPGMPSPDEDLPDDDGVVRL